MKYSDIALKVLAAKECGIIKTNAQFWGNFADREKFDKEVLNDDRVIKTSEKISGELDSSDREEGIICSYDDDFPVINGKVKNNGDKPYLLFYRGNLSLLSDLNKNIAVIGLLDPDEDIIKREADVVERLVKNELVIVSGLAIGCDTIAHKTCLETNGKTIAILPSQLGKIYPAENRDFAEVVVKKGGLLISEYYKEAASKYEAINRFIERDRLQAMFSKAIILIASYRKGEGDSGSRHAMEAARKYEIERYAMYNSKMDENDKRFGLNKDLVNSKGIDKVKILISSSIDHIKLIDNPNLSSKAYSNIGEQMTLL
ncbi:DNA-processing protein DprA [Clostridium lacusfryxellense]|uniref:DNA-processing protein DprA n=1 Tax=Clostridium lacusfryxellense TaxID=205328 RepID=UPI001C0BE8EA|nr:DNA-processing protein DprA [Clostridium lacusfryxellense]MBU3112697.1 DNA-protecting protein DprA [Clostridium lacusfryxellense]